MRMSSEFVEGYSLQCAEAQDRGPLPLSQLLPVVRLCEPGKRLAQPYYRKKLRKRERTAILSFCALQTISFNKFTTHPHSDNLAMPMCRRKQVKTSSSIQGEGAVQWQVRISSMVVPGS